MVLHTGQERNELLFSLYLCGFQVALKLTHYQKIAAIAECKIGRQSCTSYRRECLQRQREMPSLVRGRADEPAQVGQIEQPHLRVKTVSSVISL